MDVTDFTRTHPGSYHYAVEVARIVTELERVGDTAGLTDIKSHTSWLNNSVLFEFAWDAIMVARETEGNLLSRHINWLAKEILYKHWYATGTNKTELAADILSISTVTQAVTIP